MHKVITDSQLNELLRELIETANCYYAFSHSYFEDLYYTGCRSMEPLLPGRWKFINDKIILSTLKTEAIRFFDPAQLSHSLKNSIDDGLPSYGGLTYDQFTAEFRKYIKLHPIYCGNRIADTYLFRYNRAKQIMTETNDLVKVQEFFGWQSLDTANRYVTQELHYRPGNYAFT